jgi:hypothetical protein
MIRGLLCGPRVINFTQESVQAQNQWRHNYRFFIINPTGLYNISGLVTMIFNVPVSDRAQCYSVTQMDPVQDREAFLKSLRQHLEMPDLTLEDLILNAKHTLEFVISPMAYEFLPLSKLPPDVELASGPQEPIPYNYVGGIPHDHPHEHDQNDPHPGG